MLGSIGQIDTQARQLTRHDLDGAQPPFEIAVAESLPRTSVDRGSDRLVDAGREAQDQLPQQPAGEVPDRDLEFAEGTRSPRRPDQAGEGLEGRHPSVDPSATGAPQVYALPPIAPRAQPSV